MISSARDAQVQNVPTSAEAGVPNLTLDAQYRLLGPTGVSADWVTDAVLQPQRP